MALITRIILRNDSTANWLANSSACPIKGARLEFEFPESGQAVKMKVGDGLTTLTFPFPEKAWHTQPMLLTKNVLAFDAENKLTVLGF